MEPIVSLDSQLGQSVAAPWVSSQPRATAGTMSCQSPFLPVFLDVGGWTVCNNSHSSSGWI